MTIEGKRGRYVVTGSEKIEGTSARVFHVRFDPGSPSLTTLHEDSNYSTPQTGQEIPTKDIADTTEEESSE